MTGRSPPGGESHLRREAAELGTQARVLCYRVAVICQRGCRAPSADFGHGAFRMPAQDSAEKATANRGFLSDGEVPCGTCRLPYAANSTDSARSGDGPGAVVGDQLSQGPRQLVGGGHGEHLLLESFGVRPEGRLFYQAHECGADCGPVHLDRIH